MCSIFKQNQSAFNYIIHYVETRKQYSVGSKKKILYLCIKKPRLTDDTSFMLHLCMSQ